MKGHPFRQIEIRGICRYDIFEIAVPVGPVAALYYPVRRSALRLRNGSDGVVLPAGNRKNRRNCNNDYANQLFHGCKYNQKKGDDPIQRAISFSKEQISLELVFPELELGHTAGSYTCISTGAATVLLELEGLSSPISCLGLDYNPPVVAC